MSQIIFGHCSTENLGMIYVDHIPRSGEKIRIQNDPPDENGIYEINDVVYGVPVGEKQRVDIYLRKVAELPKDLSYQAYSDALNVGPYPK